MILVKRHNSHEVAHLYEHLFCMAVEYFFYEHHLFPYLDYELDGRTLRGIVYIHLKMLTTDAKRIAAELSKLTIFLDGAAFHIALLQIYSEKGHSLGATGKDTPDWDAVRSELREIEEKPWQHIDEVDMFNPEDVKLTPGSLYIPLDKKHLSMRNVMVSTALDKDFAEAHKELLPLFWQLAMFTSQSIRAGIYAGIGFYDKGLTRHPKHQTTTLKHRFHVPTLYPLDLSTILAMVREKIVHAIVDLDSTDAFNRLAVELRTATHADNDKFLPGPLYMYERTGVLMGAKGWKRIATDENCNLILLHMKVTVSSGRERSTVKVSSVLDSK